MKRNPPFTPTALPLSRLTAKFWNPDQWLEYVRTTPHDACTSWRVVQYHVSKAYWFNLNGKWVRR